MKSVAPLLSISPSGSFMRVLTALRQKSGNSLQGYHAPGGPASFRQRSQRLRYLLSTVVWNDLSAIEENFFHNEAERKRLLEFNVFVSFFLLTYFSEHIEYGSNDFGFSLYGV